MQHSHKQIAIALALFATAVAASLLIVQQGTFFRAQTNNEFDDGGIWDEGEEYYYNNDGDSYDYGEEDNADGTTEVDCEINPEDPSCMNGAADEVCNVNPHDPSCLRTEDEVDLCEVSTDDPSCIGVESKHVFCDVYPDDPSCLSEVPDEPDAAFQESLSHDDLTLNLLHDSATDASTDDSSSDSDEGIYQSIQDAIVEIKEWILNFMYPDPDQE